MRTRQEQMPFSTVPAQFNFSDIPDAQTPILEWSGASEINRIHFSTRATAGNQPNRVSQHQETVCELVCLFATRICTVYYFLA